MRWIAGFISALWGISRRSWVTLNGDLRPHSGSSALYLFLFLLFFVVGLVLVLLGFSLNDVDRWIDAQAGWLNMLGTLAFNGVLAIVLLFCAVMVVAGLYGRFSPRRQAGVVERKRRGEAEEDQPLGWGVMIGALVIGYFCWAGLFD